jgi:hypothetical protein
MLDDDPVLGKVIANYPSDRARLLLPVGVIMGLIAVILNFTLAETNPLLTVIIMAGLSLVAGWYVLHFWNREIILYEHGFSFREGSRTVLFLYHEIASIRQRAERLAYFGGLIRRAAYRFTLTTFRGESMTITNLYKRVDRLGAQLEQKIYPVLGASLRARLMQGEKVPFSATLRVSSIGLHEQGRDLNWAQFTGYQIGGGHLTLYSQPGETEWLRLPLPQVDNIPLLLEFLKRQGERQQPGEA